MIIILALIYFGDDYMHRFAEVLEVVDHSAVLASYATVALDAEEDEINSDAIA